MAFRRSDLGSLVPALMIALLVLTGQLLRCSALTLAPQRVITTTTTTEAETPPPSEVTTSKALDTDEPFTTKRNANVFFDFPKVTQFPLAVANAELKTVPATTATIRSTAQVRTTTAGPTQPPRRGPAELPIYRLNGSNGQACILLQVDALITVKYKTKLGEEQEADIYVPNDATITGNCEGENYVSMSLKWDAFILKWNFAKTPGGERWYVEKIELTFNTSDRHFEHIDKPNKTKKLSTAKLNSLLFPTPVGKSFSCEEEQEIALTDGKTRASVLLRNMKLQPFKFKNNDFAVEFSCTALSARINRDETAPLAVGTTLAATVLLTIAGYAGWRHFKIKKVQYDTME
ncbi:lysosome-associated membrane glycoprotein 5 [Copidosoma floridanum]|uniref:lysosome-associated membrane glycoprotein 5 n=1 Tax=Copidosoma floridanum TaxID=29053 RepID=UPI0006C9B4E2|nr:lysosome-associated membrane glycoprotein 5 [Copidosoma floridanum]